MEHSKRGKITKSLIVGLVVVATAGLLLTGCANEAKASDNGKKNVVATTMMLYDLTKEIAGDELNVTGLMGPGIDPHLYQASAGDVNKMQDADIVVYNGIHLEGKMGDIFADLSEQGRDIICIEDGIDQSNLLDDELIPDIYDPHIWFDVSLWKEAAKHVAVNLADFDAENADAYNANLESYLVELDELDTYIKTRIEELPESQRVLVTAHDAFRYFGEAYDFEVRGLQGISTDAEAGTADVSNLATFIAESEIKAIFVESSVPPKNIEALQAAVIAQGFNVEIGGSLYSDSLGDEQSGHNNYILTCRANIDTIVNALK